METQQNSVRMVPGSIGNGMLAVLARTIAHIGKVIAGRCALHQLQEMEEWQLTDIGICRKDIEDAGHRWWREDPTSLLEEIARAHAKQVVRKTS